VVDRVGGGGRQLAVPIAENKGVAIRGRSCDTGGPDRTVCSPYIFDDYWLAERCPHGLSQNARECIPRAAGRRGYHDGDRARWIGLRARGQRPRERRATEQRDELGAPPSITSSARAGSVGGTSRPGAVAGLRLMSSWTFGTCGTGKSAAFSPVSVRPAEGQ